MNEMEIWIEFSFSCRLIKTLLEENVNSMSDHITNAMDKMEIVLDNKIAEKDADDGEKTEWLIGIGFLCAETNVENLFLRKRI